MSFDLLLIDDDPALLHLLEATMEYGGFRSKRATNAAETLGILDRDRFDAILLDLGLPDASGEDIIKAVRAKTDASVIVVSGDVSEATKIRSLDAGADDFVEKPFLPGELLARIRAAIRRNRPLGADAEEPPELRMSSIELADQVRIRVGSKEERLLSYLNDRFGRIASSSDILRAVWNEADPQDDTRVRVAVATLRRRLDEQHVPLEIQNRHGVGYLLKERLRRLR